MHSWVNMTKVPTPCGAKPVAALCRLLEELLEDPPKSEAADVSGEEVTWETVQDVFDRVQDRSWQLLADDLTVCLRPDGTDWILGAGGFGRVRPPSTPSCSI